MSDDTPRMIEMELGRLVLRDHSLIAPQYVYLREKDGGRSFPIVVGFAEAAEMQRVVTGIETERPIEIFARLNIRHGPNTEQLVRELPHDAPGTLVEFDLAYSRLNEKRVERAWLDLIFETPDMNQVTLRDLTFARYRRAAL